MKKLIPRTSRMIPSRGLRELHLKRNSEYRLEHFKSYVDWFYFIHVDPVVRWWHALGMVAGGVLYILSFIDLIFNGFSLNAVLLFFGGMFFFYFLPLISHYFYDGGTAKSTPDRFHSTLIPVIHINFLTLSGRYDPWLNSFIEKYPFTVEAWDLIERD
jgi:hypothetical protein